MTEPDPAARPEPGPAPADLERAILGGAPELTAEQVARSAGVSLDEARRLWRALGFADAGNASAFTARDGRALKMVADAVSSSHLDFEAMLKLTRALGQTMARLADWEVATLVTSVEQQLAAEASSQDGDDRPAASRGLRTAALDLVESIGPRFEELLVYSWRRHLAAAVGRIELLGAAEEDFHVAQATVGFADLVSFTALSNELGEDEIGDLVEVFESRCSDVVASHHGRVVKTLGDSVLFMSVTPEQAIDTALDIIAVIGRDPRLPDVHLGMATGPVVLRMGDVYGPVVNLASRLTSVARRNRVIIDEVTSELLPAAEFETRRLPARPVRGFGDIEPVTVRRTRPRH
ncbi:MAG TPA: adenylate/guanylate cyclase domain-containing protein [Marmoricola sp.]|nr:adenylate/guanylate cyclase domain-containing protein [Marmoricola sp.]